MKKIASLLVVAFAFTLATQSQEKRKEKRPQLSLEQQTDLMVKKMTLALDLSEKQQQEITPLLKVRANERKIAMEKRKEMRKNETKPTADEIYAMKSKQLDNQIAFKEKMKDILDKDQFEKFEKMAKSMMQRGKKMKQKLAQRKKKMARE